MTLNNFSCGKGRKLALKFQTKNYHERLFYTNWKIVKKTALPNQMADELFFEKNEIFYNSI